MYKLLLSIALFFSIINVKAQKEKYNLPEDFGKTETTVLISPGAKDKITESMVEAFEKEYKGKFEAIDDRYPKSSKYDMTKYRYVFYITEHENPGYFVGRERFPPTTDYKFGLMDRSTGKSYEQDFYSGNYKKGARNYAENLEKLRSKNSGN
jgi:hypothetical protein